ncbi:hypothetical protein U9M48_006649 [Paspalum notatum var. saurae]|uniref:Uncharacterized protein n=1 Tax=Paspalum notatum var. saurae TaxID=547442 RepID=A0AAQ3PPJ3_PASNO
MAAATVNVTPGIEEENSTSARIPSSPPDHTSVASASKSIHRLVRVGSRLRGPWGWGTRPMRRSPAIGRL